MISETSRRAPDVTLDSSWTRCKTVRTLTIGSRCRTSVSELAKFRVRDEAGAFRVMYVAKFKEAVFVLHAFQKKTRKTSKKDVQLAKGRYAEMIELRKHQP